MNPIRRFIIALGLVSLVPALRAKDIRNLSAVPDKPVGFGYKTIWLAIKSNDSDTVAKALGLKSIQPANWASGVSIGYKSLLQPGRNHHIFVTPPVQGWVFVIGNLPTPKARDDAAEREMDASFQRLFGHLAKQFKDVQLFANYRTVDFVAWARARDGRIERIYSAAEGSIGTNFGKQTDEERRLGFLDLGERSPQAATEYADAQADAQEAKAQAAAKAGLLSPREANIAIHTHGPRCFPNEDDCMALAGAWSIDPTRLNDRSLAPGVGIVGSLLLST